MGEKIGLVSLGCPKNLVDSEIMLGMLKKEGYEITDCEDQADILIVNTCGFIDSAKQESINTILEMAQYKEGKCRLLIVTGCLAERYSGMIRQEIPEVDAVLGTASYDKIIEIIEKAFSGEKPVICDTHRGVEYLENERLLSTQKGFAYIKIAEGCSNCCTYCVIPSIRGPFRSRKIESIKKEAEILSQKGVKELILVAQDTTLYGIDIYKSREIIKLVRELSTIENIEWIRLLYCYPEEMDDELINEIASNDKVCKYIDLPLQHISDKILKAMGRRGTGEGIKKLIGKLREKVPGIVLRTSLIVGFPGEDENDFESLYKFVEDTRFDRLGVFTYSREEGTPAARMKSQVIKKEKIKRYNKIMELQKKISFEKNLERVGKIYKTIVQGVADDGIFYYGRTYAEAPEIDGVVYFTAQRPLNIGEFANVRILNSEEYDLIGEVIG
ncbi:MAG TPA: 30S ribosomal protein S12 methylthiotransferase RimO [Clostridiaceae bacterium]|nr:30S ribosomal protein S12 methylthiotransferase RimO [Clostridiaceae bacterium]